MTHRPRTAPALLLAALAVTGLAACGGSDVDDAATDDTATEATGGTEASSDTTAAADEPSDDLDTGGDTEVGASSSAADCTATGQVSGGITADLADAEVVVNPGIDDSQALYDLTLPDGEVITFFAFADQAGNAVINTADPNVTWSDFASEGIQLGADFSGGTFDVTMSGFDDGDSIDDVTVTGEISCG